LGQLAGKPSLEDKLKFINSNPIWKGLESSLKVLSHGKCWYSEARELFSYYHVDHFRPKKLYWWLAYDWKNYRLCGSVGNVNKRTSFPLQDETRRAVELESALCDEIVCLLDPTQLDDCMLLTFDESGRTQPTAPKASWPFQRAVTTIEIMKLNYIPLVEGRKQTWQKCLLFINRAQRLIKESPSATNQTLLKSTIEDLRLVVSEEAELSMTARACVISTSIGRGITWPLNLL